MSEETTSVQHSDKQIRMFKTDQEERDLAAFLRSHLVSVVSMDFSGRDGDMGIYSLDFYNDQDKLIGYIGSTTEYDLWPAGGSRTLLDFLFERLEEAIEQTGIDCKYDDGGTGWCNIKVTDGDALQIELHIGVRVVSVEGHDFSAGRKEATWTE